MENIWALLLIVFSIGVGVGWLGRDRDAGNRTYRQMRQEHREQRERVLRELEQSRRK